MSFGTHRWYLIIEIEVPGHTLRQLEKKENRARLDRLGITLSIFKAAGISLHIGLVKKAGQHNWATIIVTPNSTHKESHTRHLHAPKVLLVDELAKEEGI